jgi:hypothetical protein
MVELSIDEDDRHPNPFQILLNIRMASNVVHGEREVDTRITLAGGCWNRSH